MNVVKFIEENIELIDEGSFCDFFTKCYFELNHIEMENVLKILNAAEIETKQCREDVLRFIITMTLENWKPFSERDCYIMNFAAERLNHTLGLAQDEVVEFIKDNASEWSDYVTISVSDGSWDIMKPVSKS